MPPYQRYYGMQVDCVRKSLPCPRDHGGRNLGLSCRGLWTIQECRISAEQTYTSFDHVLSPGQQNGIMAGMSTVTSHQYTLPPLAICIVGSQVMAKRLRVWAFHLILDMTDSILHLPTYSPADLFSTTKNMGVTISLELHSAMSPAKVLKGASLPYNQKISSATDSLTH